MVVDQQNIAHRNNFREKIEAPSHPRVGTPPQYRANVRSSTAEMRTFSQFGQDGRANLSVEGEAVSL